MFYPEVVYIYIKYTLSLKSYQFLLYNFRPTFLKQVLKIMPNAREQVFMSRVLEMPLKMNLYVSADVAREKNCHCSMAVNVGLNMSKFAMLHRKMVTSPCE